MPAYFDEKKKTWYVKFRYRDFTGKLKDTTKRGFKRKKDALQYEINFKQAHNGDFSNLPFSVITEKYLQHQEITVRKTTFRNIRNMINKYILPFFGNLTISKISVREIIEWHDNFLLRGGFAPTTIKTINGRLSAIFNYAKKYYKLKENPVILAGPIGSLKRKDEYTIWTIEQLELFCKSFEKQFPVHALAFRILFYLGLRPSELLGLTPADIDFEQNTVSINKSYHGEGGGYFADTKNPYSVRKIVFPSFLRDNLMKIVEKTNKVDTGRLFYITEGSLYSFLVRHSKKLSLPVIRLYDLRHSHASILISNGQDINLIAKRMGHCSPETTLKIYSHAYKTKNDKIADFFDETHNK